MPYGRIKMEDCRSAYYKISNHLKIEINSKISVSNSLDSSGTNCLKDSLC